MAEAKRNSKGQFVKGESGNPAGRHKLPENFKNYANQSPEKLWAIAEDENTPLQHRASIYQWFMEMFYGKPKQQVDLDAEQRLTGTMDVQFEGVLDEWAT